MVEINNKCDTCTYEDPEGGVCAFNCPFTEEEPDPQYNEETGEHSWSWIQANCF